MALVTSSHLSNRSRLPMWNLISRKFIFWIFLPVVLASAGSQTTLAQTALAQAIEPRSGQRVGQATARAGSEVSRTNGRNRKRRGDAWRYTSRGWYQLGHINGSVAVPTHRLRMNPLWLAGFELAVAVGLLMTSRFSPRGTGERTVVRIRSSRRNRTRVSSVQTMTVG